MKNNGKKGIPNILLTRAQSFSLSCVLLVKVFGWMPRGKINRCQKFYCWYCKSKDRFYLQCRSFSKWKLLIGDILIQTWDILSVCDALRDMGKHQQSLIDTHTTKWTETVQVNCQSRSMYFCRVAIKTGVFSLQEIFLVLLILEGEFLFNPPKM